MRASLPLTVFAGVLLTLSLSACSPGTATDTDTGTDTGTETETTDTGSTGATVGGTGTFSIPDQMPYGDYQLVGDPGTLPDGCTWAIRDADGGITAENQGAYVFITEIDEASTFETNGCPDWEQY